MRRLLQLFLFLHVLPCVIHAQSIDTDSLATVVDNMPNDTLKIPILEKLAYELANSNKPAAFRRINQSMELSKKLKYEPGIAGANDVLGIIYLDRGVLDSAKLFLLKALDFHERNENKEKMLASYQKLGQVHMYANSFDEALSYYDKEFDIAAELGDNKMLGNANNDLASLYISKGWHTLDNLKDTVNFKNHFEEAIPYIHKAIKFFEDAEYGKGMALAYGNLSILKKESGDYQSALTYMKNATKYFQKNDLKIYLASAYNQINSIYQHLGQFDSALYYVELSMVMAREMESKFDIRNAYGQYRYIYELLGDYKKAHENNIKYHEVHQEIFEEHKQVQIDELNIKYQSDQNVQDLEVERIKNKNQRTILIFILLMALASAVIATIYWQKNVNEHKLNELLKEKSEELEISNQMISQQNAKLKENSNQQGNLMAVMAHDLRAPLNNVKGLTKILEMSGPLNEEQKRYSNMTAQVVENGLDLIADIMSLSKTENGEDMKLEDEDLYELLSAIVESHASYSLRKNIILSFIPGDGSCMIETDKSFIIRIFDNLISNAIKFSPANSEVEITYHTKGEDVVISVKDHGPGMSEDDLKNAFKRFKKLSAQPTGGENSTGLGLSIVKTLVEKLNGEVSIDTKVGKGTTFSVRLPMKTTVDENLSEPS